MSAGILLSALVSSCGLSSSNLDDSSGAETNCVLNADQGATLKGRWMQGSVPIAFEAGAWSQQEMQAGAAAVASWNSFFATSMGYPAIDIGNPATPRVSSLPLPTNSTEFCSNQPQIINANFSYVPGDAVVIYKDLTWPYDPADNQVIALTTLCPASSLGRKIPYFNNGYMEVNYEDFFLNGNRVPDLQSILLHEFGHLMGLKHSCEFGSTQTGMPDCGESTLPTDYLHSVMFPTFSFSQAGAGEIRRTLEEDDEGRINCIYKFL